MFTEKEVIIIKALVEEDIWESGMIQDSLVQRYKNSLARIQFKLREGE